MTRNFADWKYAPNPRERTLLQRIETALDTGANFVADDLAKQFLYGSLTDTTTQRRAYALLRIAAGRH